MAEIKLQSQQRAAFAFACIQNALTLDNDVQAKLKAFIQELPAMIQMNGFGQAIAYCKSRPESRRGGEVYQLIYSWLSDWLNAQRIYNKDLMSAICDGKMSDYQLATAETQALLVWLKKLARAYLAVNDSNKRA